MGGTREAASDNRPRESFCISSESSNDPPVIEMMVASDCTSCRESLESSRTNRQSGSLTHHFLCIGERTITLWMAFSAEGIWGSFLNINPRLKIIRLPAAAHISADAHRVNYPDPRPKRETAAEEKCFRSSNLTNGFHSFAKNHRPCF